MFQGLRTVIYRVSDLARAKEWYAALVGFGPYFDEPFYVGFNVGGYELGLDPDAEGATSGDSVVTYWGVADARAAFESILPRNPGDHKLCILYSRVAPAQSR